MLEHLQTRSHCKRQVPSFILVRLFLAGTECVCSRFRSTLQYFRSIPCHFERYRCLRRPSTQTAFFAVPSLQAITFLELYRYSSHCLLKKSTTPPFLFQRNSLHFLQFLFIILDCFVLFLNPMPLNNAFSLHV